MRGSLWTALVPLGVGLKVGRNYVGKCLLDEPIELEDGLKWTGAEDVRLASDIVKLPTRVVVPINHEIVEERLVFRRVMRVSEVAYHMGPQPGMAKSTFDLELRWGVAPSYGKELKYWKRFFSEMIPNHLTKGAVPNPSLEEEITNYTIQYLWLKSVAYEVDMIVHNYSNNSRWTITGHFPLVSATGGVIGVYGLDNVCSKSLADKIFPNEDNGPQLLYALTEFKCKNTSHSYM
ncbi:hypothetical protein DSO57_1035037 [Entomophthora muscae]|uniref:Uncharacterized protein n=1 Tax=Entomophthora muscae TaxID=34485 RepID=A0ACC2TMH8_9FUNG|nr:hypothetical protein DSO57_1035037 [Entomophthora muscae]